MSAQHKAGTELRRSPLRAPASRSPSEDKIEAQASKHGDARAGPEVAEAEPFHQPPSPEQVRALPGRLRLTQANWSALRLHARHGPAIRTRAAAPLRTRIDIAAGHRGRSGRGRARSPIARGRLKRHPGVRGGIEGVLCLQEAMWVDAFKPSTFSIVIRGMRYSSRSRCVTFGRRSATQTRAADSESRRRITYRRSRGSRAS